MVPLLPRVSNGDSLAVRELVSRYERLVWALVRRFGFDEADAEDALQDVFLSLWQNAARFDPSVASEPVFVTVVARRRLIDRARGRKRRLFTEPLDESHVDENENLHPDRCIEAARAVQALDVLSPDQRKVLVLSTRDGLTQEEIAEHTGLPLGTVKTHVRRALIRVREALIGKLPALVRET